MAALSCQKALRGHCFALIFLVSLQLLTPRPPQRASIGLRVAALSLSRLPAPPLRCWLPPPRSGLGPLPHTAPLPGWALIHASVPVTQM